MLYIKMSGNIHDTDVDLIKKKVQLLLNDLEQIIDKKESPKDHVYSLEKKYKYIKTTSPGLFNFIIQQYGTHKFNKDNFLKNLDMMLNEIANIQKSKISQYDASVKIGTSIASQYIPQLKK